MPKSTLHYSLKRFLDANEKTRFIVNHLKNNSVPICISLFEHHQFNSGNSPNSLSKAIYELLYFYTWADIANLQIDSLLLNGPGISEVNVRQFCYWLKLRNGRSGKPISIKSYNSIVNQCARFCAWCGQWNATRPFDSEAGFKIEMMKVAVHDTWKSNSIRNRNAKLAPNLEDHEINVIDDYLKPLHSISRGDSPEIAYRNYLMWRLAIEMGLRISEILSLRLQDCTGPNHNFISVVRTDERSSECKDPRGAYSPRPKTLSRDLGYIFKNSPLQFVLREYIGKFRYKKTADGHKQFLLDHDFLILTKASGKPLSNSFATKIAVKIAQGSGIKGFHWHLARHSFFNRAYAAVLDNQSQLNDLVYYGGWSDQKSLDIYVQKAIKERSRKALSAWQKGENWKPSL